MWIVRPALAIAAFVAAGMALAGTGPTIKFDKHVHDYGKVMYGETVTEEFLVTNAGDETLVIEQLRSTCGCTKAIHGSKEIPPKGSSKIVAAFDTTGLKPGKKVQSVFVHSNDPQNPVVKLTIEADVIREITIEPPTVAKQMATFMESISFPMQVSNASDKPCVLTGVKEQPEGVTAQLDPSRVVIRPGQRAPFNLVLKPVKEPDRHLYIGSVQLTMDHPKEREAEIRYLLKINKAR